MSSNERSVLISLFLVVIALLLMPVLLGYDPAVGIPPLGISGDTNVFVGNIMNIVRVLIIIVSAIVLFLERLGNRNNNNCMSRKEYKICFYAIIVFLSTYVIQIIWVLSLPKQI